MCLTPHGQPNGCRYQRPAAKKSGTTSSFPAQTRSPRCCARSPRCSRDAQKTIGNASTVGSKWRTPVEEPPNEDPPQGQRSQHAASMTVVIQKARLGFSTDAPPTTAQSTWSCECCVAVHEHQRAATLVRRAHLQGMAQRARQVTRSCRREMDSGPPAQRHVRAFLTSSKGLR